MKVSGSSTIALGAALLAGWVFAAPALAAEPPAWGEAEIRASRIVHHAPGTLPDKVQFTADPMGLIVVVESGDHHVTILDGDRLMPIHRFQSRVALRGSPQFTPDGRHVFFASRDGWISRFDLWNLRTVAEIRAGIDTRNVAVSGDGRYIAVANGLPHTLVILDADLQLVKILPVADKDGRRGSRVSAVYRAAPRRSFVAALQDVRELWEVSYDPGAPEVALGMVHDFRYREGAFVPGFLNPKRSILDDYLDDFCFTPDYNELMGVSREGRQGQVIHLDVRRRIAALDLPGVPHAGAGITWTRRGRRVMAIPNLAEGIVTIIDVNDWRPIKQIKVLGPGFFMTTHENSRYAWVDAMMSPAHKDTMQVLDKDTLEIVATLTPAAGKNLGHVGLTRDGRYALVSQVETDGALIVYDAATLEEIKRIPVKQPAGAYNVRNQIRRPDSTSR